MQSVLITGTSKGIGFETALAFARAGYRVHATMRNPPLRSRERKRSSSLDGTGRLSRCKTETAFSRLVHLPWHAWPTFTRSLSNSH
jgi:NAD(P)-dependent dehydrogenase (short-subunit alcohol dehydrogenase family)